MKEAHPSPLRTGIVVIGRNEGKRLEAGLRTILTLCSSAPVVYVDSGSTDNSVAFARSLGIDVVQLDLSVPFTAARARNAGFSKLVAERPYVAYVQFMDGDCELHEGWIETAISALELDQTKGVVSGRRMEKFPDASIYNTIIDIEWNTAVGETRAVLGDMCVRTAVFKEVGGFNEGLIAAEDDDICIRIRLAGYRIFRLDATMSHHDANILRLSQWYKRSQRAGHAFANINHLHGKEAERYFQRELTSAVLWGGATPLVFLGFLMVSPPISMLILVVYCTNIVRTTIRTLRRGHGFRVSATYGLLIYTGKVAEMFGVLEYWKNHLLSRTHQLIEYK